MNILEEFMQLLVGKFDNHEQVQKLQDNNYPYAKHINTICNDKIENLPDDFKGYFMVEESYYTIHDKTNASSHLFLFTQEEDEIKLTSYDLPNGYDSQTFTYEIMEKVDFNSLKVSNKFVPALYSLNNGIWEGGSISMFAPTVKFTLYERFSYDFLEVSESIEVNGKRTFGYDIPILYKRIK